MPFFTSWRYLSHGSLINLSDEPNCSLLLLCRGALTPKIPDSALFESGIVKPHIVVSTIMRELFFVLDPPLP